MTELEIEVIEKLDKEDREKIAYFTELLLQKSKYHPLKKEIEKRREEIKNSDVLMHEEIWNKMNV
ncbi:MAG TPA: hypothetical protein ENK44_13340 [Caldithrix abyssi]|uniref:DUF2281 domain-containing protein n=1 Tax=Caldithrix abyssi TaxID=187145 RepID=A0A7V4U279_CALAY|nr:hypothetical protein [Caldithrix abyssi]